jgi:hypothetical protein
MRKHVHIIGFALAFSCCVSSSIQKQLTFIAPKSISVAVLVLGDHRVYDCAWPTHEKFLYTPIREHQTTQRLDIFICQKGSQVLPSTMPPPTAAFNVDGDQKESFPRCFAHLLDWVCSSDTGACTTNGSALTHFEQRYDWVIRTRPDVVMVYAIPWPPPSRQDPLSAEVLAHVHEGCFRAYAWRHLVKVNMLSAAYRKVAIESDGCPPNNAAALHDPCVDIVDQFALIQSTAAAVYFGFPSKDYPFVVNTTTLSMSAQERLQESCQFPVSSDHPFENVLNHRLHRSGISVAPYELPYILAPTRNKPMVRKVTREATFVSCLKGGAKEKKDRETLLRAMRAIANHKDTRLRCVNGVSLTHVT